MRHCPRSASRSLRAGIGQAAGIRIDRTFGRPVGIAETGGSTRRCQRCSGYGAKGQDIAARDLFHDVLPSSCLGHQQTLRQASAVGSPGWSSHGRGMRRLPAVSPVPRANTAGDRGSADKGPCRCLGAAILAEARARGILRTPQRFQYCPTQLAHRPTEVTDGSVPARKMAIFLER